MVSQMKVNLPSFTNVIFGQGRDCCCTEQKLGEAEACLLWESSTRNSSVLNDVGRRDRGGGEMECIPRRDSMCKIVANFIKKFRYPY